MRFTEKECLLSSSLSPYKNNNTKSGHWKCPVIQNYFIIQKRPTCTPLDDDDGGGRKKWNDEL